MRGSYLLRLILIAVLVGVVIWSSNLDGFYLDRINFFAITASQPAAWLALLFMAWRVRVISGGKVSLSQGLKSSAITVLASYLLPARISDGVKAIFLRASIGLPLSEGLPILFIERTTDVICILIMAGIAGFFVGDRLSDLSGGAALLIISLLVAMLIVGLVVIRGKSLNLLVNRIPWGAVRRFVNDSLRAVNAMSTRRRAWSSILLAMLTWVFSYLVFVSYFEAMDGRLLSAGNILIVFLAATLGLTVSILPAGIGTFEGAIVITMTRWGYSTSECVLIAFSLRLANMLPILCVSLWILLVDRFKLSKLRLPSKDDFKGAE